MGPYQKRESCYAEEPRKCTQNERLREREREMGREGKNKGRRESKIQRGADGERESRAKAERCCDWSR